MSREDFRLFSFVLGWAFVIFLILMGIIMLCLRGEESAPQGGAAVVVQTAPTPLLVAARSGTAVDRNTLVVPGESIGKYKLGWTLERFIAEWGPPAHARATDFSFVDGRRTALGRHHFWDRGPGAGFRVITHLSGRGAVVALSVRYTRETPNTVYQTKDGIGLLSAQSEIQGAYGAPSDVWTTGAKRVVSYRDRGIAFSVLRTNDPRRAAVLEMWVFRPTR